MMHLPSDRHNKRLYVWTKGGFASFSGLLILGGIWLLPLSRLACRERRGGLVPLIGLPVILSVMAEYLLYLSAFHLMLLLLLFRQGMADEVLHAVRLSAVIRIMVAGLAIPGAGLARQLELTRAEVDMNNGAFPTLPSPGWKSLTQAERLQRDLYLLMANTAGFGYDNTNLQHFEARGNRWLSIHNDADVSATMIFFARLKGDAEQAELLRVNAAGVFVKDSQFSEGDK